jgi:hypothetical protein
MKKIFLLLILVGITFLSCSDNLDNTIVTTSSNIHKFTKSAPHSFNIYTWLYTSRLIDGSIGCDFIYDTTFVNTQGNEINVYARLKIEPGAFNGIAEIIMIPNVENLSIKLFPEMTFNEEVKLTLIFTGIEVQTFGYKETGLVDFAYFSDSGEIEPIESDMSHVNVPQDQIKVMNAKLNHFSRYGWIR